jgi:hypothetical protein
MSSNKVHVMVDIECYDVVPTAVILSLGAVTMHRADQQTFYAEYATDTQYERTRSISTIEWWAQQSTPLPQGLTALKDGLIDFALWLRDLRAEPIIWCKGTDFDTAILAHAFNQYAMAAPWKYNHVRDMRTLKKCHPQLNYVENQQPHHALQDAINQAVHLNQIFAYNQYLQWE